MMAEARAGAQGLSAALAVLGAEGSAAGSAKLPGGRFATAGAWGGAGGGGHVGEFTPCRLAWHRVSADISLFTDARTEGTWPGRPVRCSPTCPAPPRRTSWSWPSGSGPRARATSCPSPSRCARRGAGGGGRDAPHAGNGGVRRDAGGDPVRHLPHAGVFRRDPAAGGRAGAAPRCCTFGFTWLSLALLVFTWTLIALTMIDVDHQLRRDVGLQTTPRRRTRGRHLRHR